MPDDEQRARVMGGAAARVVPSGGRKRASARVRSEQAAEVPRRRSGHWAPVPTVSKRLTSSF